MKIKPMICTQCGAPINRERMICEYCGTRYEKKNNDMLRIETYTVTPVMLDGYVAYPKEFALAVDPGELSKMVCGQLATKIADELAKYIDYAVQEDPISDHVTVRGRVRVLPPGYRF